MKNISFFCIFFVLLVRMSFATSDKQVYIVYMGEKMHEDHNVVHEHVHNFLANALGSSVEEAQSNMIHTYKRSFTGFSAMLTDEQAANIISKDEVVSMFPSKSHRLHTTHSWSFVNTLGSFQTQFQSYHPQNYSNAGQDVIVGVLDTGVWPESASFSDENMPAIPSRWKGTCQEGEQFPAQTCNKKLIGARFYTAGYERSDPEQQKSFIKSARDTGGHGTHTSSTAAGNVVEGVSFPGGIAAGTARGGSPNSRIAVYKVCWDDCKDEDILAAFDDAIADGVDLLSLSLGSDTPQLNYFQDAISIGAFHAAMKNILVSCSAGNDGPLASTATNLSPWILTVAASSIDRKFNSGVMLGNKQILQGQGINPSDSEYFPLTLGSTLAAAGVTPANASFCLQHTLDNSKSQGKIVVCKLGAPLKSTGQKAIEVKRAGGAGIVVIDDLTKEIAQPLVVPGLIIPKASEALLTAYLKDARYPVARVLRTITVLDDKPSPKVAVFSSRGPSTVTPDIIKPDITAPGLTILAAWSPISVSRAGNRTVDYNLLSGTSMSCPHITGVAALLKGLHPSWTPAMIKSAIMTTATNVDNTRNPIRNTFTETAATPFDFGSGHVNPLAAADPGLVYDTGADDYISFACPGLKPSPGALRNLSISKCPTETTPAFNLNYPSIGVANLQGELTVTRTVTNVGPAVSFYRVKVSPPEGISVSVSPSELNFTTSLEKRSFRVELRTVTPLNRFVFGALVWTDGARIVRSPIAVNATC